MQVRKLLLLCFAVISSLGFSQFRFNEYSCANVGAVKDPLGIGYERSPDWIELINTSPNVQNFTGWTISTDRGRNHFFQIQEYNNHPIYTDSFALQVIYLCGHNTYTTGTIGTQTVDIHADFQLNQTQSTAPVVYLFGPTAGSPPVDSIVIRRNQPDHSWGKPNSDSADFYVDTTSGGVGFGLDQWMLYQVASPGKKNPNNSHPVGTPALSIPNNYYLDYAPTPKLMTKPGYYASGIQLNITDTTSAVIMNTLIDGVINIKDSLEIFATTDCTTPLTFSANATIPSTANIFDCGPNGPGGPTPLPIPYYNSGAPTPLPNLVGVVVRAVMHDQSVRPNYLDGFEAYGAYILDSTYHMNATCFCLDTAALFTSPAPPQINDTVSAIYCYISNTTKKQVYKNQGQGLVNRIDFLNTPTTAKLQWQFQFRSEDEYGYNYTNKYPFFTDQSLGLTNRPDFPELIFRSSAEDNFLKGGYNGVKQHGATHLRDFFNHTLTLRHKLNFESSHYVPTYLFINGINKGIYYIKEPIDTMYTNYYYNHAQANIIACDLIPTTTTPQITALAGNLTVWNNFYLWAMSNSFNVHSPTLYQKFSDSLDIPSFIDYNFYNMFSVNNNFVKNQALWWKGYATDSSDHPKWRFGLSNTDITWGSNHGNGSIISTPCDYNTGSAANLQHPLMPLFFKLLNNDTFKSAFYSRYQDLLNTSYACDSITTHLTYVKSLLTKDIASQVYWNASPTASISGDTVKLWNNFVDSVNSFIMQRCSLALKSMAANCLFGDGPFNLCIDVQPEKTGNVHFNTLSLTSYTWNGSYVDSVTYHANAIPDSNYVFDHWETPYAVSPSYTSDSISFMVNKNACLTAVFKLKPSYETYGTPMLPGAFSPNGDGNNDVLNLYGIANASSYSFEIYNRWGEQLFHSTDKTKGWDGTYPDGTPAAVGVYAYRYDIIINSKTYVKNGSITLLR